MKKTFVCFPKFPLCICVVLMFLMLIPAGNAFADGEPKILNVELHEMDFTLGNAGPVKGKAKQKDAVYRYYEVLKKDGITIDVEVKIAELDGASLGEFDAEGANHNKKRFEPTVSTSGNSGGQVNFEFSFYENGTNLPVYLHGFALSAIDIDGKTEFVMIRGYDYFITSKEKVSGKNYRELDITYPGNGFTKFQATGAGKDGTVFYDKNSFIAYYDLPVTKLNVIIGNKNKQTTARMHSLNIGNVDKAYKFPNEEKTYNKDKPEIEVKIHSDNENIGNTEGNDVISVPVSGTTERVEKGQTVIITVTDGTNTVATETTVDSDGKYAVEMDLSGLSGNITAEATVTNKNGTPANATDKGKLGEWRLVKFDANGGMMEDESDSSKTVKYGETVEELPAQPFKEGHIFTGWNTNIDGEGAVFDENTPVKKSITVYAQWEAKAYTVTFDSNGGEGEVPAGGDYPEGATFEIPTAGNLTKEGYTFKGWTTDDSGEGELYEPGSKYTIGDQKTTFYAKWLETGKEPTEIKLETNTNEPVEVPIGENEGTDPKLTEEPNNGTVTIDEDGKITYEPNEDFNGEDEFTITVTDEDGKDREIAVRVSVKKSGPNSPPEVDNYNWTTDYEKPVSGRVLGTDPDNDPLTYTKGKNPENGTVKINSDGSWTYKPNKGFSGQDNFTVVVDDGRGGVATSTITVTVNPQEIITVGIEMKANPNTIVADGKSTSDLTARVTDSKGNPIAGVTTVFNAEKGTFPHGDTTVTDSDGYASVVFQSDKIEDTVSRYIIVTATVNDEERGLYGEDNIIITFEPSSIKGIVTDNKTGEPIEGARVVVTNSDFDFEAEYVTGSDGKYKIAIPKGDVKYDVEITKPITLNGETQEISFKQKAQAGEITGVAQEEFPAEKTFTGLILKKDKDGKDRIAGKDNDQEKIIIKQLAPSGTTVKKAEVDSKTGTFSIGKLSVNESYQFVIVEEVDGQELVMGKMEVTLDEDGEISIHEELIDPYGTITDSNTGDTLGGVYVRLFYADTPRNTAKGKTPGQLVDLPELAGFAPNDNRNPQISIPTTVFNDHPDVEDHGNYAWMVFPEADYYIVAIKKGYHDYTSETISVDWDVVKHDFAMKPVVGPAPEQKITVLDYKEDTRYETTVKGKVTANDKDGDDLTYTIGNKPNNGTVTMDSSGNWTYTPEDGFTGTDTFIVVVEDGKGGIAISTITITVTPKSTGGGGGSSKSTPKPSDTEYDVTVDMSSDKRSYYEETDLDLEIKYIDKKGNIKDAELVVTIPDSATVKDPQGGTVDGDQVTWKIKDPKIKETKTKNLIVKLPETISAEQDMEIEAAIKTGGRVVSNISKLKITVFSNRYGNEQHLKYIYGYPDGEFKPNRSITRAEIAVIFARLLDLDGLVENEKIYNDVELTNWHARGVEAATKRGLFAGSAGSNFRPNDPITRGELAVVIGRYLELPDSPPMEILFEDTGDHWALNYIAELYKNNVVSGYEDGTFKPESSLRRSEAVTMINRMLNRGPLQGIEPTYPDVGKDHWAFGHVEESSVSHEYYRNADGSETFVKELSGKYDI